jgi:hypothetical protein
VRDLPLRVSIRCFVGSVSNMRRDGAIVVKRTVTQREKIGEISVAGPVADIAIGRDGPEAEIG